MKFKYIYSFAIILAMLSTMFAGAAPAQGANQGQPSQDGNSQGSHNAFIIRGRVLNGQAGLQIQAHNSLGETISEVITQNNGFFFFKPLPKLSYRLIVLDSQGKPLSLNPSSMNYVTPHADSIIEYNLSLASIPALLHKNSPQRTLAGNSISGTVKKHSDYATPVAGVTVNVYSTNTGSPSPVQSTATAADGIYTITGLAEGTYYAGFIPQPGSGFSAQYYSDKTTLADAEEIYVSNDFGATYIDGYLSRGGGVSGIVTGGDTKAPVSNVDIEVMDQATERYKGSGTSDTNGAYTITDLDPGSYTIKISPPSDSSYVDQYYNNQPSEDKADSVLVSSSVVPGINAILALGGTIAGKVTDLDAVTPLEDVQVTAWIDWGCYWSSVRSDTTDAQGLYSIPSLAPGKYLLEFQPGGKSKANLAEYYNHKISLETADPVTVTAGATTPINTALTKGGVISGTITAADTSGPLQDVYVDVYDKNNYYAVSTITDAQGHYSTPGLKSGTYHVDFYPSIDSVSSSYISEYYNIKANYKTADPVIVTTPNLTPNINAALTKGGVITGVVKAADTSSLLDDVTIDIYDKDGNFVGYSYTNSSGVYTTIGLPTGNYRLYFSSDTYTEARYYTNQYYQGKASLSEATPVTVNAPLITSGINVNLVKGGSITGTVFMQDDSTPVSEAEVEAYDSANHAIRSDYSNTQGAYQLTGLSAGGYRVHFYIWCQNTNYEDYYNKKSTLAAANQVAVTPPEEIGNINGHLKIVPVQPVVIPRVYLPYVHH